VPETLTIDGSLGEGGGQILRSALALSIITGRPFRIYNIRANRSRPGLRRQHLTAVKAAARIVGAMVAGAEAGASELTFEPGPVQPDDYEFDVGTGGSTTLVLQTILPPLLLAAAPSQVTLVGGTHNFGAPPLDFLEKSFLPLLRRMGPGVELDMARPGFAQRGGGRFTAFIEPVRALAPIAVTERGALRRRLCKAVVAGLPRNIAERELGVIRHGTGWPAECFEVVELPPEFGPGNVVMIEVEAECGTEVFTGFGQKGVWAETVAHGALKQCLRYLDAGVPVGDCLADQLLLPLALAGGGSFLTLPLTRHSQTNIEVIRMFLDVRIAREEVEPGKWLVRVGSG
jgi:RNA 3'-terminal phosphate cyclase (ATP)